MKIGILTLQYPDNYGAMLQAYALQTFLKEVCDDVSIINYLPIDYFRYYAIFDVGGKIFLKNRIERLIKLRHYAKQHRLFSGFRKKYLQLSKRVTSKSIKSHLQNYDYVVYGSDQIWNEAINGQDEVYYGKYVNDSKRVSYAASFGTDNISNYQQNMIRSYLVRFHGLSCRDAHGTVYINSVLEINKCKYVFDPVFLLEKNEWNRILVHSKYESQIVYYALSENDQLNCQTEKLSKETGYSVTKIHPLCKDFLSIGKMEKQIGPREFLGLILNAKYICTDSFHALCFSIIFGKKVIAIPTSGKGARLVSLLDKLSNFKMVENGIDMYNMYGAIDYLQNEIINSKDFLYSSLNFHED